ncbi:hypothetical protein ABZ780_31425 [Micromonospora sp. NPDC047467]|uniref:hypothetical protein n=1 Tax=Micromonospora sp. NPDC047467 TaxID=3154814 RepID=UPI0033E56584
MSDGARPGPPPGIRPGPPTAARPGPPPGGSYVTRPAPPVSARPGPPDFGEAGDDSARHPAVDAAVRAMANAAMLAPADQIAQYEAAYETLRETLATIDQT